MGDVENLLWKIRQKVAYVAEHNLGYGEDGNSNWSRFIAAIGGKRGDRWCATFAGYCYERAYELCNEEMPFKRSQGAKTLIRNLADSGDGTYLDQRRVLPGDLVGWHRGLVGGHVGVVVRVSQFWFETIEGNVNNTTKRVMHAYGEPKLWRCAGLR